MYKADTPVIVILFYLHIAAVLTHWFMSTHVYYIYMYSVYIIRMPATGLWKYEFPCVLYQELGTPNEEIWSGYSSLPVTKKVMSYHEGETERGRGREGGREGGQR